MSDEPPIYEVISDRDRAYCFCLKFMSLDRTPKQRGIILTKRGDIQAAVVYDWFTGSNVFMHCAGRPGRKWLNRDFLHWVFHYPFFQLHVARVSLWIDANNADSIRFATHLGFTHEATLAGASQAGVDALLYVMKREDCRHVQDLRQTR